MHSFHLLRPEFCAGMVWLCTVVVIPGHLLWWKMVSVNEILPKRSRECRSLEGRCQIQKPRLGCPSFIGSLKLYGSMDRPRLSACPSSWVTLPEKECFPFLSLLFPLTDSFSGNRGERSTRHVSCVPVKLWSLQHVLCYAMQWISWSFVGSILPFIRTPYAGGGWI